MQTGFLYKKSDHATSSWIFTIGLLFFSSRTWMDILIFQKLYVEKLYSNVYQNNQTDPEFQICDGKSC
jgi:hypothetical protein